MPHTISIPMRVIDGADLILRKRQSYGICVRAAYKFWCRGLDQAAILTALKTHYVHRYGMEAYAVICAMQEAKGLWQLDCRAQRDYERQTNRRLAENTRRTELRAQAKAEIQRLRAHLTQSAKDSPPKSPSVPAAHILRAIRRQQQILDRKPLLPDLPHRAIGHMVFGGKAALFAHQRRMERMLAEQFQIFAQVQAQETRSEAAQALVRHLAVLEEQRQTAKLAWKARRLRPFAISGETRCRGNRFFQLSDDLRTCTLKFGRHLSGTNSGPVIVEHATLALSPMRGKWADSLVALQRLAKAGQITLAFRLDSKALHITYDAMDLRRLPPGQTLAQSKALDGRRPRGRPPKRDHTGQLIPPKVPRRSQQRMDNYPQFVHPEYRMMPHIHGDRAIGIDLNPKAIGVSVIAVQPPQDATGAAVSVQDDRWHHLDRVQVLDTRLFHLPGAVACTQAYHKAAMRQALSAVAEEIIRLAQVYQAGLIVHEDGLGRLRGQTRARSLNGCLNTWGRRVFLDILARRAYLTRRVLSDGTQAQAIGIQPVWPAYSSIIGNLVAWPVSIDPAVCRMRDRTRKPTGNSPSSIMPTSLVHDSGNPTAMAVALPDACAASVEVARRGLVAKLTGSPFCTLPPVDPGWLQDRWKKLKLDLAVIPQSWGEVVSQINSAQGSLQQRRAIELRAPHWDPGRPGGHDIRRLQGHAVVPTRSKTQLCMLRPGWGGHNGVVE